LYQQYLMQVLAYSQCFLQKIRAREYSTLYRRSSGSRDNMKTSMALPIMGNKNILRLQVI